MIQVRVVIYPEKLRFSLVSKRCCSCRFFKTDRSIYNVEKFCEGIVVWLLCEPEGFCEKLGKKISERRMCRQHRPAHEILAAASERLKY